MSVVDRVYHKKHFYKVTWERSEVLRKEVPWLKDVKDAFCIVGYREPTMEEAERFIGSKMYDRLFDRVCSVEEISKEVALRDFVMDDWNLQKAFGFDEVHKGIDAVLHSAVLRSELRIGEKIHSDDYVR